MAESVVLARGPDGYKQLVAFYRAHGATAEHTVTLSHRELREHLMLRLPEYMIPAGFIGLGTIPLSSNGKADRGALERLEVALEASQDYRPPTSEEERQLCELSLPVAECLA